MTPWQQYSKQINKCNRPPAYTVHLPVPNVDKDFLFEGEEIADCVILVFQSTINYSSCNMIILIQCRFTGSMWPLHACMVYIFMYICTEDVDTHKRH